MIWSVPQCFKEKTVFIVAGGPSLRNVKYLSELHKHGAVIVVNDAWRLLPNCDMLYFSDASFYEQSIQRDLWSLDMSINFGQLLYKRTFVNGGVTAPFREHPQVHQLLFTGVGGLEKNPSGLRHGHNSGYAAINLAYHTGARRIVLLGYDMQSVNGRSHWHDEVRPQSFDLIINSQFLPHYPSLAKALEEEDVEVVNATSGSALDCWPLVSLTDVLDAPEQTFRTLRSRCDQEQSEKHAPTTDAKAAQ